MDKYSIGLDIGTTSAKAVLFQHDGVCAEEAEVFYELLHPQRGYSEQDPYAIEAAAVEALKKLEAEKYHVVSAGFSAAMHTLICLDGQGEALTNSITWADTRSREETKELLDLPRALELYQRTGTPIHTMSPLTKLYWLKQQQPETFQKTAAFVSIKEFILRRWFGENVVDYSIASATGMFNIHTKAWDQATLKDLNLEETKLSQVVAPTYILAPMREEVRKACGLQENITFAVGGSDGALANLGMGALRHGDTALTIGTSGAVRQMSSTPAVSDKQQTFCYAFDEKMWLVGGPTNNGGIALQWLQNMLKIHETEKLLAEAGELLPEADAPIFLPYLQGERAPVWDPAARGAFINLSIEHEQKHMSRAVLEGVIFSVYEVFEDVEKITGATKHLRVSGGFSRSPLWLQIAADVFGTDLSIPVSYQSSAWGAAWCSMMANGDKSSYDEINDCIPLKETVTANMENHRLYQGRFEKYRRLYQALKPLQP